MNRPIQKLAIAAIVMVVALLANVTYVQVFKADELRSDTRNSRVLLDEYSRQRGQITAAGQLMANSVATDGRFRYLRVYPNPYEYAPVTGFYSLTYSSSGLERAEDTILNGSDERLFGRRLADFFTGTPSGVRLRDDWIGARRIINGSDRARTVAQHGRRFLAAIRPAA